MVMDLEHTVSPSLFIPRVSKEATKEANYRGQYQGKEKGNLKQTIPTRVASVA